MKNFTRYTVIVVMFLMITTIAEATSTNNRIFPTATGLTGKVTGSSVNMRVLPDQSARVVKRIGNTTVQVVGKRNEWYKVRYGQQEYWMHNQYVQVDRPDLIPVSKTQGDEIVAYGAQFIGTPYVWGGNNLNRGVDCSGLTQQVFKAFDIEISRVSYMQARDGQTISKSNLQTGDLVFFDTNDTGNKGNISHVGIYVGEDKFLHADSTHGVMISSLNSNYYTRNYVKGVRVLS